MREATLDVILHQTCWLGFRPSVLLLLLLFLIQADVVNTVCQMCWLVQRLWWCVPVGGIVDWCHFSVLESTDKRNHCAEQSKHKEQLKQRGYLELRWGRSADQHNASGWSEWHRGGRYHWLALLDFLLWIERLLSVFSLVQNRWRELVHQVIFVIVVCEKL